VTYDLVIVGGGLQAALIAVAVHARAPGRRIAILERGERLGGNHTWCFHATDVSPRMAEHLAPLIGHRWGGYDVAFPRYRRTLASGYAAIPSDRVDPVVRGLGPTVEVIDRATASAVGPGRVELTDGREFTAPWVIDARGPDHHVGVGGYQKFVGVELVLDRPHGVTRPLLMDARVAQIDGYRFLYVLPLAPDRLLVEDTYFSAGAYLDVATVAARARAYADEHGWRGQLVRTESGVLPLAWQADVVEPVPGLLVAGYAGRLVPSGDRLLAADGGAPRRGHRRRPGHRRSAGAVAAAVAAQRAQLGFATRLVWMMFRWFPAGERRGVLEHFYRLPPDTIGRFYALTMTRADRARVFLRRPPRGLSWRAVLSGGATLEAR
jgi:lycopene beta-cyclase